MDELGVRSLDINCKQYVNLTWLPPSEGQVDAYFLECRSAVDVINKTVGNTVLNSVLGPLVGEAEYTCSVSAVNAFGTGPSASAGPFKTS